MSDMGPIPADWLRFRLDRFTGHDLSPSHTRYPPRALANCGFQYELLHATPVFKPVCPTFGAYYFGARMNRTLLVFLLAMACQTANAFPSYATGGFRGANLMTSDEIKAHVERLMSFKSFTECESYMDAHEQILQKRAQEQHVTLPEKSGDPCKVMRFFGRIQ
jgi:hypothetical protein